MIRRETLSMPPDGPTYLDAMREVRRVQRGESVRIIGLGTLVRRDAPGDVPVYRLTLTAAVAPRPSAYTSPEWALPSDLHTDVRHIAAALGAPVEIYAPGKRRGCDCGAEACAFCGAYNYQADFRAQFAPRRVATVKP